MAREFVFAEPCGSFIAADEDAAVGVAYEGAFDCLSCEVEIACDRIESIDGLFIDEMPEVMTSPITYSIPIAAEGDIFSTFSFDRLFLKSSK